MKLIISFLLILLILILGIFLPFINNPFIPLNAIPPYRPDSKISIFDIFVNAELRNLNIWSSNLKVIPNLAIYLLLLMCITPLTLILFCISFFKRSLRIPTLTCMISLIVIEFLLFFSLRNYHETLLQQFKSEVLPQKNEYIIKYKLFIKTMEEYIGEIKLEIGFLFQILSLFLFLISILTFKI